MKKIITFTLCAALIAVCFSGCIVVNFNDFNTVAGKGDLERYELSVGEYSGIKAEGSLEIRYRAASSNIVILEVQPNLREYFTLEVINGDLVIRTTRRISMDSRKTPVLTISTPVLNRLSIEGMAIFTAHDKITADSFTLVISGAGKGKAELDVENLFAHFSGMGIFELSGRADNADLNLSGSGELNALSLQTQTAEISLAGTGKVTINCARDLRINASGMGTVEYSGSPDIDLNRSGMVNVRKLD